MMKIHLTLTGVLITWTLILSAWIVCTPRARGDEWTAGDTAREVVVIGTLFLDWQQTRWMTGQRPDPTAPFAAPRAAGDPAPTRRGGFREMNPLLGSYPSRQKIDAYFAACAVGHAAVAYTLSPKYRHIWQYVLIGLESGVVGRNVVVQGGMHFSF